MDPRRYIKVSKDYSKSIDWSTDDLPPRWSIYPRSRKMPPSWEWRAAHVRDQFGCQYIILAQAHVALNKWSAWLILEDGEGKTLLARVEQHGASGEGIHIHADCESTRRSFGAESINAASNGNRLPSDPMGARRIIEWTRNSFWEYACQVFRINEPAGKPAPGIEQLELDV